MRGSRRCGCGAAVLRRRPCGRRRSSFRFHFDRCDGCVHHAAAARLDRGRHCACRHRARRDSGCCHWIRCHRPRRHWCHRARRRVCRRKAWCSNASCRNASCSNAWRGSAWLSNAGLCNAWHSGIRRRGGCRPHRRGLNRNGGRKNLGSGVAGPRAGNYRRWNRSRSLTNRLLRWSRRRSIGRNCRRRSRGGGSYRRRPRSRTRHDRWRRDGHRDRVGRRGLNCRDHSAGYGGAAGRLQGWHDGCRRRPIRPCRNRAEFSNDLTPRGGRFHRFDGGGEGGDRLRADNHRREIALGDFGLKPLLVRQVRSRRRNDGVRLA